MHTDYTRDPNAKPVLFSLTAKQKRMIVLGASVVLVIAGAFAAYAYFSGTQGRAQAQYQEAMRLMKPGFYKEAIAGFNRAIETWPGLADAYFERGNARHILGQDDEALADFEKAVQVDPALYRAYAAMGSIYRGRNDIKKAMELFTRSIDAKPTVDAYFERGVTYEALGEHQKAVEDFDKALSEQPDSPAVYRARSMARRNLGDQSGYEADRDMARSMETRK
jgi:tetratricopeptide (TPR) repeat protein